MLSNPSSALGSLKFEFAHWDAGYAMWNFNTGFSRMLVPTCPSHAVQGGSPSCDGKAPPGHGLTQLGEPSERHARQHD
jgi:hypothetical protein